LCVFLSLFFFWLFFFFFLKKTAELERLRTNTGWTQKLDREDLVLFMKEQT
jgi:hypothetical protein